MTQHENGGVSTDNANDAGGHDVPDAQVVDLLPGTSETVQPPASNEPPASTDADEHDDDGDSAARKARREAAGLRKRLRDTETERDELRDALTRQQQAIIDRDCAAASLTDRHVAAAQIGLETMRDDETGLIDTERLEQAISTAVREFRPSRPPSPNYQQGRATGQPGENAAEAFAKAFAPPQQ